MLDHPQRPQRPRQAAVAPLSRADRAALVALSAVLGIVGAHLVGSRRASRTFGAGEPEASSTLFRRVAGLRTAWLGLATLTLHRAGQHRALGWLLLAMAANPASDLALAAATGGGRRSLVHLPGTLATAILGARLLRLTRHRRQLPR